LQKIKVTTEELHQQQCFLLDGVFNIFLSFVSLVSFFSDNSTPQLSQNFTFKSFICASQLGQFNLNHEILFFNVRIINREKKLLI